MDGRRRAKRRERLGALGNAIVPQVAELVAYRVIEILEWQDTRGTEGEPADRDR
jgi:hypothetical protein